MRRKKKTFWKPVIAGFGTVYFLTMILATVLVKAKFTEDFAHRFEEIVSYIAGRASDKEHDMEEEGWAGEDVRREFYQSDVANGCLWRLDDARMQISVGVYDKDKTRLAQTRNEVGGNSVWGENGLVLKYASFGLEDYLSPQEKEELVGYYWEDIRSADPARPEKYRFSIRTSPDGKTLWEIYVQEITWTAKEDWNGENYVDPLTGCGYSMEMANVDYETGEEVTTGEFEQTDSKILWHWTNPGIRKQELKEGIISNTSLRLPYMTAYETWRDYENWKTWDRSQYLHDFSEQGEFTWEEGTEEPPFIVDSDGWYYRGRYQLQIGMLGDPASYMEVRMESRPWLAALDYMKYVYLAGFVLTFVCAVKIVYVFRKTYEAQMALEETRRDFTNAMAHELKTPLGVIRNFAENMLEHNMEEKRDYYLAQMIHQTEEMDRLVVKMIEISKLDSEDLVLKKEQVSFAQLAKEQLTRFEPVIEEKKIHVLFEETGDFAVDGDREYLAGAVWNLLSNAVDYNISSGEIRIKTERDKCVIQNTGAPMTEDELLHAFDMFYMGNESRSKEAGHMGMGLFLTKKVLELHGLNITLANTDYGIEAEIKRR